jgi:hypothetical protein
MRGPSWGDPGTGVPSWAPDGSTGGPRLPDAMRRWFRDAGVGKMREGGRPVGEGRAMGRPGLGRRRPPGRDQNVVYWVLSLPISL